MSQPDPLYALEKLSEAVHELVVGVGRVQERLGAAAIYLIRIRSENMPNEALRRALVAIKDDLSFDEPKGTEGRIAATLRKTNDEDASAIARRVFDLYRDLDQTLK